MQLSIQCVLVLSFNEENRKKKRNIKTETVPSTVHENNIFRKLRIILPYTTSVQEAIITHNYANNMKLIHFFHFPSKTTPPAIYDQALHDDFPHCEKVM